MNRQLIYSLLIAGASLGTAWAIRGQFGHEQGAAWAGSIIAISIVLLAKRPDWYSKTLQLALASAAGWGIGGIISYGIVVGYGRGSDFGNVYYGFLMLFVIGGLFGLLGGGMFGLMLADTATKPVKWHRLLTEMTASAVIFYYLLIEEFGWLMTPPRSEAWAACFGMMIALFWYMIRNKQYSAIRVAIFAGLGGGFGFSFGNFLQVMGNVSGIHFNFWNVMEYSIGFFGGAGMAYGTFTSDWPKSEATINRNKLIAPLAILVLVIPFIVWDQTFETKRIFEMLTAISPTIDAVSMTKNVQWIALLSVLISAGLWFYYFYFKQKKQSIDLTYNNISNFLFGHLGLYTFFSILITGAFLSIYRLEQYLYIANIIVIYFLIGKYQPVFTNRGLNINRWFVNLLFLLAIIALYTAVAIASHGELKGAQVRFD
jgi:hypothetical protein